MPIFFKRQVLIKDEPGAYFVPSGTLTSETNETQSQRVMAVGAGGVEVGNGVTTGSTKPVEVGAVVKVGSVIAPDDWVAVGWPPVWLAAWVSSASMVWAAAVTMGLKVATALGVPEGPQAVTSKRMVVKSSGIRNLLEVRIIFSFA